MNNDSVENKCGDCAKFTPTKRDPITFHNLNPRDEPRGTKITMVWGITTCSARFKKHTTDTPCDANPGEFKAKG